MLDELTAMPVRKLAHAISRRQISPREAAAAFVERIAASGDNAVVTVSDTIEEDAARAEVALMQGEAVGPLHGVPFTVKDNIATAGVRSTAGSRLLAAHVPAVDAPVIERMRRAGALVLGKTNCPEFALEPRTHNDLFGTTTNPLNRGRSPGGSSGGEAAAQTSSCSPLGFGTDYGGSVRFPAHCCGTVGIRPTVGRVPSIGQLPGGDVVSPRAQISMIGPMARYVDDLRLVLSVVSGPHPDDQATVHAVPVTPGAEPEQVLARLRCSWSGLDVLGPMSPDVVHAVVEAAAALSDLGVVVEEATPPGLRRAEEIYASLRATDDLANLRELATERRDLLTSGMRALLATESHATLAEYRSLKTETALLRGSVLRFLEVSPILLLPIAASAAPAADAGSVDVRGSSLSLFEILAPSRVISLLGLPALAVPCSAAADGMPLGVQVVGRPFHEDEVLAVGAALEGALGGWGGLAAPRQQAGKDSWR